MKRFDISTSHTSNTCKVSADEYRTQGLRLPFSHVQFFYTVSICPAIKKYFKNLESSSLHHKKRIRRFTVWGYCPFNSFILAFKAEQERLPEALGMLLILGGHLTSKSLKWLGIEELWVLIHWKGIQQLAVKTEFTIVWYRSAELPLKVLSTVLYERETHTNGETHCANCTYMYMALMSKTFLTNNCHRFILFQRYPWGLKLQGSREWLILSIKMSSLTINLLN